MEIYKEYQNTPHWQVIEDAIDRLIKNNDIELMTDSKYVVGFICKQILQNEELDNKADGNARNIPDAT